MFFVGVVNESLAGRKLETRLELNQKCLAKAWFLYAFLELSQRYGSHNFFNLKLNDFVCRYGVFPAFSIGDSDSDSSWLDGALLQYHQQLRDVFRLQWTAHRCDVEGCQKILVAGKIYYIL